MAWNWSVCSTRTPITRFKDKEGWTKLVAKAIEKGRFYQETRTTPYGIYEIKGTPSTTGPEGFVMEEFIETQEIKLNIDMYESTLIYKYLVTINQQLKEFKIETVQSCPAYFEFDITFTSNPCYLQNPWVELCGDLSSITIVFFKLLVIHPLLSNYIVTLYQEDSYSHKYITDDSKSLRLSIIRDYIDDNGDVITDFDDTEFWENIIKSIDETKTLYLEEKEEFDITKNDPELDTTKDWYVYDNSCQLQLIEDKNALNPLNGFPLTTLEVRYEPKRYLFLQQHILQEEVTVIEGELPVIDEEEEEK